MVADAAVTGLPVREQSDLDLVDRFRYGDPGAFEEIYRRFAEMVYNLTLRLARNRADADDLTQEVFLRIYRHLPKFRSRSTLKTWIYRVTLNHCRSRLRRGRYAQRPLGEHEERTLTDPSRGPESKALASDTERQVSDALGSVKQVYREAVVLRDLEGLSYTEIAEVLGVRVGTVRSRIARGRDQLRALLEVTE